MSKFKVVWDTLQYFKDDRILKNDYNHGFKTFKIYNICGKLPNKVQIIPINKK